MSLEYDFDPEDLRRVAVRVAGEAAALLRGLACSGEELSKNVGGETVLADVIAEDYIIDALKEELGKVRVLTEEKGEVGSGELTAIVDPLDGSKNYLNCIPWASVSIAIAPTGATTGEVISGAVAPIFYGVPLSFARGRGCYVGMERVAPAREPQRFIFVYIEHPSAAETVARIIAGLGGGYKIRSLGSAALEIAYTGLGRATLFLDLRSKLRNVDLAAAAGIVEECGGVVADSNGNPHRIPLDSVRRAGNVIAAPSGETIKNIINLL